MIARALAVPSASCITENAARRGKLYARGHNFRAGDGVLINVQPADERVAMASQDDHLAEYVEFVHAAQHRLQRTAYLMTGDWSAAADLTQEALIKLYLAWPRLQKGGGVPTYARRTLISTVLDHQRSRRRRPEEPRPEMDLRVVNDQTGSHAERDLLVLALRQIAPRQRACVVLRYFEGLSISETAEALNCSDGNVKSQTSAALASLRRILDELDPEGRPGSRLDSDAVGGGRR